MINYLGDHSNLNPHNSSGEGHGYWTGLGFGYGYLYGTSGGLGRGDLIEASYGSRPGDGYGFGDIPQSDGADRSFRIPT